MLDHKVGKVKLAIGLVSIILLSVSTILFYRNSKQSTQNDRSKKYSQNERERPNRTKKSNKKSSSKESNIPKEIRIECSYKSDVLKCPSKSQSIVKALGFWKGIIDPDGARVAAAKVGSQVILYVNLYAAGKRRWPTIESGDIDGNPVRVESELTSDIDRRRKVIIYIGQKPKSKMRQDPSIHLDDRVGRRSIRFYPDSAVVAQANALLDMK